jgi:hypothetical protein
MAGISCVDCVAPALALMRRRLFEPFRFDYWSRLAVLGILAGELSSSGHYGRGRHGTHGIAPSFPHTNPQPNAHDIPDVIPHLNPHSNASAWIGQHWHILLGAIGAAIVVSLLFLYIGSVLRFVLYEAVLRDRAQIREGWVRWSDAGLEYFAFRLMVMVPYGFVAIYFVGVPLWRVFAAGGGGQELFATYVRLAGGVALVGFLGPIVGVVMVMTKDFVVPQMMFEGISCAEGWRRLWHQVKAEPGSFAAYILLKIVLVIPAYIMFAIALVILAIPAALVIATAVVVIKMTGLGHVAAFPAIIPAILLGVIAGVPGIIYVVGFVGAPISVFFPAYSIYYFASRYRPLYDEVYGAPAGTQELPR